MGLLPLVLLLSALLALGPAAQALASSASVGPPRLVAAWTPSTTGWVGSRRSALLSIEGKHCRSIMTRGGGSPNPRCPLLSSAALELEAGGGGVRAPVAGGGGGGGVVSADADGVVLRDGRHLRFGFRPRGWVSYLVVWANAVLLTFARKHLLPFRRHWQIKGLTDASAGGVAVAVVFHLLESWIYAQPLLQLQLQLCHRPKLVPAEELALPPFSRFLDVDVAGQGEGRRIRVHALVHKHRPEPQPSQEQERRYLLHFNHGFGASALSFEPVLADLASSLVVDATAIAHDAPGFGLTLEPEKGEDALYGFASNARLGTALVEQVEAEERAEVGGDADGNAGGEITQVYVGHSMGALTSAFMALDRLKRMDARSSEQRQQHQQPRVTLILVAPAILPMRERPTGGSRRFLGGVVPRVGRFFWQTLGLHVAVLGTLRYFLRSLAYDKGFWQRGLRLAWGEGSGPGDRTLSHYRLPSLKRGWDRSLARFVLAPLQQKPPGEGPSQEEQRGGTYANLVEELAARVREGSLRLLLVHGQRDRVVPVPNTRRLHAAMPGSTLWELPGIGHVPHEEAPERFVQQIVDFLLLTEEDGGARG